MKNNRYLSLTAAAIAVTMILAGCSDTTLGSKTVSSDGSSSSSVTYTFGSSESTTDSEQTITESVKLSEGSDNVASSDDSVLDTGDMFTDRDLEQAADTEDAVSITAEDSKTAEITEAGVYVISGKASNFTVKVEAGDEDKVQIVLDGADITNDSTPVIYVISADKVFITTASDSSLSVTGSFTADGDTNTDAVIYSKDDIVLNGTASLTISSTGNGITGKDDIKVTGGTYSITSALDAIEANDSIRIADGCFVINSQKDGLHSENSDDSTQGYIYISGGCFDITAASDGIQGTAVVQIDGGEFRISSSEGIESTCVQINGGSIDISATDDGINTAQKTNAYTVCFEMTGGELSISMNGNDVDCIDSNGNVTVSGGTINVSYPVSGPSESFDYDGTTTFTGGTIIINGEQVSEIPTPTMMGGGRGGNMGDMGGFGGRGGRMM
ncbi:carbohydrate-binding domain-containing protein [Ruminococcus sp. NK3A76]|uniref:carbohydrate-binding domain-containing protein n=1 Tax=Ruminococcus sp. NK3A76 TaxID=877411 RepID=UPI0006925756|nr:carbohydrate-binding domain-containing protein [Ruminococcus sp. NK3A76]